VITTNAVDVWRPILDGLGDDDRVCGPAGRIRALVRRIDELEARIADAERTRPGLVRTGW
jgi:hypothetical protein